MELRRAFVAVLTRALAALALVAGLGAPARAQLGREATPPIAARWASCAGDGAAPPVRGRGPLAWSLQLSALATGWGAAYSGRDARLVFGDAVDGQGVYLRTARLGLCGRLATRAGTLVWNVVYEPGDLVERAQPDGRGWGRLDAAELGFSPWAWATLSAGVRKVAFAFGHDEPEELLALPIRPYAATSIAPDRRLGLTLDAEFGVAHIVLGLYQGRRDLVITSDGGLVISARLTAEPIGPVGNTPSTIVDTDFWRRRSRFAVNASILYQFTGGVSTYAIGADLAYKRGPFGVVGEYLYSARTSLEAPEILLPRPRLLRQGAWLSLLAMLWRPWIEAAARWDWLDSPQPGQHYHAVTVGLNSYVYGDVLRLQAAYTRKLHYGEPRITGTLADDVFLFSATLGLAWATGR